MLFDIYPHGGISRSAITSDTNIKQAILRDGDVLVSSVRSSYGQLSRCTAATFYSVSISKPIPVWFGKKFKILTTRFPNQFQFGLEKNYNFDDSFSKPIPVWFGKNDHISEAKNSKLIIIWTKESWFPASVTGSSFLKLC